jgi:hypothetical protein
VELVVNLYEFLKKLGGPISIPYFEADSIHDTVTAPLRMVNERLPVFTEYKEDLQAVSAG